VWHAFCFAVPVWHAQFGIDSHSTLAETHHRQLNSELPKTKGNNMDQLKDAIAEVRRELLIRKNVYPRLVSGGKLTQSEANRRLEHLQWAHAFLLKLIRHWPAVASLDGNPIPNDNPQMD
jgi:hypothetical protein